MSKCPAVARGGRGWALLELIDVLSPQTCRRLYTFQDARNIIYGLKKILSSKLGEFRRNLSFSDTNTALEDTMWFSRFQISGRVLIFLMSTDANGRITWYVYSEWEQSNWTSCVLKDLQIRFRVALSRNGQWNCFTIYRFTSINTQNKLNTGTFGVEAMLKNKFCGTHALQDIWRGNPKTRKPETGIRGRKPESGIHKLKKTSSSNLTKLRNLFCIAFAGKK